MRIVDLDVEAHRWPLPTPMLSGLSYGLAEVGSAVVRLGTDTGLTGLGLLFTSRLPGERQVAALVEDFRPVVVGRDPFEHEAIWARPYSIPTRTRWASPDS